MRRSFRLLVFLLVPKQSDKTFDLNLPPKTQHLGALPRHRSGDLGQFIRVETGFNDWDGRRGDARLDNRDIRPFQNIDTGPP